MELLQQLRQVIEHLIKHQNLTEEHRKTIKKIKNYFEQLNNTFYEQNGFSLSKDDYSLIEAYIEYEILFQFSEFQRIKQESGVNAAKKYLENLIDHEQENYLADLDVVDADDNISDLSFISHCWQVVLTGFAVDPQKHSLGDLYKSFVEDMQPHIEGMCESYEETFYIQKTLQLLSKKVEALLEDDPSQKKSLELISNTNIEFSRILISLFPTAAHNLESIQDYENYFVGVNRIFSTKNFNQETLEHYEEQLKKYIELLEQDGYLDTSLACAPSSLKTSLSEIYQINYFITLLQIASDPQSSDQDKYVKYSRQITDILKQNPELELLSHPAVKGCQEYSEKVFQIIFKDQKHFKNLCTHLRKLIETLHKRMNPSTASQAPENLEDSLSEQFASQLTGDFVLAELKKIASALQGAESLIAKDEMERLTIEYTFFLINQNGNNFLNVEDFSHIESSLKTELKLCNYEIYIQSKKVNKDDIIHLDMLLDHFTHARNEAIAFYTEGIAFYQLVHFIKCKKLLTSFPEAELSKKERELLQRVTKILDEANVHIRDELISNLNSDDYSLCTGYIYLYYKYCDPSSAEILPLLRALSNYANNNKNNLRELLSQINTAISGFSQIDENLNYSPKFDPKKVAIFHFIEKLLEIAKEDNNISSHEAYPKLIEEFQKVKELYDPIIAEGKKEKKQAEQTPPEMSTQRALNYAEWLLSDRDDADTEETDFSNITLERFMEMATLVKELGQDPFAKEMAEWAIEQYADGTLPKDFSEKGYAQAINDEYQKCKQDADNTLNDFLQGFRDLGREDFKKDVSFHNDDSSSEGEALDEKPDENNQDGDQEQNSIDRRMPDEADEEPGDDIAKKYHKMPDVPDEEPDDDIAEKHHKMPDEPDEEPGDDIANEDQELIPDWISPNKHARPDGIEPQPQYTPAADDSSIIDLEEILKNNPYIDGNGREVMFPYIQPYVNKAPELKTQELKTQAVSQKIPSQEISSQERLPQEVSLEKNNRSARSMETQNRSRSVSTTGGRSNARSTVNTRRHSLSHSFAKTYSTITTPKPPAKTPVFQGGGHGNNNPYEFLKDYAPNFVTEQEKFEQSVSAANKKQFEQSMKGSTRQAPRNRTNAGQTFRVPQKTVTPRYHVSRGYGVMQTPAPHLAMMYLTHTASYTITKNPALSRDLAELSLYPSAYLTYAYYANSVGVKGGFRAVIYSMTSPLIQRAAPYALKGSAIVGKTSKVLFLPMLVAALPMTLHRLHYKAYESEQAYKKSLARMVDHAAKSHSLSREKTSIFHNPTIKHEAKPFILYSEAKRFLTEQKNGKTGNPSTIDNILQETRYMAYCDVKNSQLSRQKINLTLAIVDHYHSLVALPEKERQEILSKQKNPSGKKLDLFSDEAQLEVKNFAKTLRHLKSSLKSLTQISNDFLKESRQNTLKEEDRLKIAKQYLLKKTQQLETVRQEANLKQNYNMLYTSFLNESKKTKSFISLIEKRKASPRKNRPGFFMNKENFIQFRTNWRDLATREEKERYFEAKNGLYSIEKPTKNTILMETRLMAYTNAEWTIHTKERIQAYHSLINTYKALYAEFQVIQNPQKSSALYQHYASEDSLQDFYDLFDHGVFKKTIFKNYKEKNIFTPQAMNYVADFEKNTLFISQKMRHLFLQSKLFMMQSHYQNSVNEKQALILAKSYLNSRKHIISSMQPEHGLQSKSDKGTTSKNQIYADTLEMIFSKNDFLAQNMLSIMRDEIGKERANFYKNETLEKMHLKTNHFFNLLEQRKRNSGQDLLDFFGKRLYQKPGEDRNKSPIRIFEPQSNPDDIFSSGLLDH